MRVRNHKIELFEKRNITEKPILIFGNMIFLMILISGGLLMHGLYKETGSVIGVSITSVITFLMLASAYFGLMNGSFAENEHDKEYIKLKKGRKHDFLEHYFNDIQCRNNSNYYKNSNLYKHFKKQLLRPFLWTAGLVLFPTIIFLWTMYLVGDFIRFLPIMFLLFPFTFVFLYVAFENYSTIKNIITDGNVCILRRNVKSYYVYKDWIFFY